MDRAAIACLVALVACGPRAPSRQPDFGVDEPHPVEDSIACPAAQLEAFALRLGAPLEIANEPIVDSARTDRVPCKPAETDEACLARARARPAPPSYELKDATINGDDLRVETTYMLDGQQVVEQFPDVRAFVDKLKGLQAAGHRIVLVDSHTIADAPSRHATVTYRGVGGREQRVAHLRWRPENTDLAMADAQAAERIEIRSMNVDEHGDLVITATCGL